MSHTIATKTEYRDKEVLKRSIEGLGWKVLGEGEFNFGGTRNVGLGFKIPKWTHPVVFTEDGTLRFDDYHGRWGNKADLELLRAEYAIAVVEAHCNSVGWITERQSAGDLLIYHPGGPVTVSPQGVVDAVNFTGPSCQAAVEEIAAVIGSETSRSCKTEMAHVEQDVQVYE